MYWEEAAVAAGSSLIVFTVFSIQAVLHIGPIEGFPMILQQVFGLDAQVGRPRRQWGAAIASGVFAAIGQIPVLVVTIYRADDLGLAARLVIGGELLASVAWLALLWHWVRPSSRA